LAVPILGSDLASFAVLGASEVTNVPTSTIGGNLGAAPGTEVGGGYDFRFGSLQQNTPLAQNAQIQLDAAILALNVGTLLPLGSGDLSTLSPIAPGNYIVPNAAINISGDLTLDGGGSNAAVWIFHFPSTTLTTSTISTVNVVNVGDGAGVGLYWDVGSTAVLNGPTFAGNVLAGASITSDGDPTLACGRLLAATGSRALDPPPPRLQSRRPRRHRPPASPQVS
jgi:ice-binding like protein